MPQPLPPVTIKVRRVDSLQHHSLNDGDMAQQLDDAVHMLMHAYRKVSRGRFDKQLQSEGTYFLISQLAVRLIGSGSSLRGYVVFVWREHLRRRGTVPYPNELFGRRAVNAWLPQYLKRARQVLPATTYRPTPERRSAYQERFKRGSTEVLRVHAQFRERGDGAAAGRSRSSVARRKPHET